MSEAMKQWNAALYARISREDSSNEYSIVNQQKRLYEYVGYQGEEFLSTQLYVDIGASGSNSEREQFIRMLRDVQEKRINCVIVKDLSRLSRNYYEAGYYLDYLFPSLDVRFISLEYPALDSYKFPNMMNSVMIPMQNVVNDDFCRQTSVKVRNVLRMKQERGDFIGAFAPYGYTKHPNDRHRLVVDDDAAIVVQLIFHWYVNNNMTPSGVVRKLNFMGILPPGAYKQAKGLHYYNRDIGINPPLWQLSTVSGILKNQVYIGNLVQGRQRSQNYKTQKIVNVPEDEWIIVEGTHQPIVSPDLFMKAQDKLERKNKPKQENGAVYLFSGLLRCVECRKAMMRKPVSRYAYFRCRTYYEQSKAACSSHSIREDRLAEIVQNILRIHIRLSTDALYIQDAVTFSPASDDYGFRIDRLIAQQQRLLRRLTHYKKSIYQDWKESAISREEFDRFNSEYHHEIQAAEDSLVRLSEEKENIPHQRNEINHQLTQFIATKELPNFTNALLKRLIDRIEIDRTGDVAIHFRFKDPLLELIESQ